jgi:hypothetical protein
LANLREQLIQQLRGWARLIVANDLFKLKLAEGIAEGIFGLTDAHDGKWSQMTLPACEFLCRFFLHVLPNGFVRIRHFGFLANCFRARRLSLCRQLLNPSFLRSRRPRCAASFRSRRAHYLARSSYFVGMRKRNFSRTPGWSLALIGNASGKQCSGTQEIHARRFR